jgi:hypothetical protein
MREQKWELEEPIQSGPVEFLASRWTRHGVHGVLPPKNIDGSWASQDPLICSIPLDYEGCYLHKETEKYEGSPWLYALYAPS